MSSILCVNNNRVNVSGFSTSHKNGAKIQTANYNAVSAQANGSKAGSPHMPYLSNISFGRSVEEHNSWGATVQDDGSVSFKIWATKGKIEGKERKIKDVYVEISSPKKSDDLPFEEGFIDIEEYDGEVKLRSKSNNSTLIKLDQKSNGIFKGNSYKANSGDNYRYLLVYEDGTVKGMKDPNAKKQNGVYSWSTIYDHKDFKWTDSHWQKINNPRHISKKESGVVPTISEIHVGVIDEKGNFDSVKKKIDEYARKGTFNTIELLPAEGCYFDPQKGLGYNWGYDGVDKTAPTKSYGGPDKLKELVDYAHNKGINMMMDMVPNHMGPYGNYLPMVADYEAKNASAPWGMAFNYEGKDNRYVRDYMVNASLNWLNNYHFDGIRFDATSQMNSNYTMKQIAKECHFHAPNSYLICEDFGSNPGDGGKLCNASVIRSSYERAEEMSRADDKERVHIDLIEDISRNNSDLSRLDFDSQWDFPFHHSLTSLVLGRTYSNYRPSMNEFLFTFKNGPFNTKYFMSHDEVGNNSGTRLVAKIAAYKLDLSNRIPPYDETQNWQQMAESSQAFLRASRDSKSEVWTPEYQYKNFKITKHVSHEEFQKAYKQAKDLNRVALATIFIAPGPKMIFDGDEKGSINRFKFFAEHQSARSLEQCSNEKGYDTSLPAFLESKQTAHTDNYDEETERLSDKLFKLFNSSPALQSQQNDGKHFASYGYEIPKVAHVIRKEGNDEILAIMNFGEENFKEFILNDIPTGKWKEVISTKEDSPHNGTLSARDSHLNITLPKQSVVIFKKVG